MQILKKLTKKLIHLQEKNLGGISANRLSISEGGFKGMDIIKTDYYRSKDRGVNEDDNMVRITVIMAKNEYCKFKKSITLLSDDTALDEVPNVTDDNIQELREIILDSGSSRNYQNKKIREWFVRHFVQYYAYLTEAL